MSTLVSNLRVPTSPNYRADSANGSDGTSNSRIDRLPSCCYLEPLTIDLGVVAASSVRLATAT
jgi:hypothetical protein